MDTYNVRVVYYGRKSGRVHSLNINWDTKEYMKDVWNSGFETLLEAKLAQDVVNLEKELIRSGFKNITHSNGC